MRKRKRSPEAILAEKLGFRSILEHEVSKALTACGIVWEYEPIERTMNYSITTKKKSVECTDCGGNSFRQSHTYLPDFYLPDYNLFIESKGYFRQGAADRKKLEELSKQGERIVVLFQSPNLKLSKSSKTTYAQWADGRGVKWLYFKDNEWISKLKSIFK